MSYATLLLGDLDFQPLIAALVRFGVRVTVYYEAGAREELLEVADERHPLTLSEYCVLSPPTFKSNNVFPSFQEPGVPGYPTRIKNGSWNGHNVFLSGHTDNTGVVPPFELFVEGGNEAKGQNIGLYFNAPDPDHNKLRLAFELGYGGTIAWQ